MLTAGSNRTGCCISAQRMTTSSLERILTDTDMSWHDLLKCASKCGFTGRELSAAKNYLVKHRPEVVLSWMVRVLNRYYPSMLPLVANTNDICEFVRILAAEGATFSFFRRFFGLSKQKVNACLSSNS